MKDLVLALVALIIIVAIWFWWKYETSMKNIRRFRKQAKIKKEARRRMIEKFINKIFGGGKKS